MSQQTESALSHFKIDGPFKKYILTAGCQLNLIFFSYLYLSKLLTNNMSFRVQLKQGEHEEIIKYDHMEVIAVNIV